MKLALFICLLISYSLKAETISCGTFVTLESMSEGGIATGKCNGKPAFFSASENTKVQGIAIAISEAGSLTKMTLTPPGGVLMKDSWSWVKAQVGLKKFEIQGFEMDTKDLFSDSRLSKNWDGTLAVKEKKPVIKSNCEEVSEQYAVCDGVRYVRDSSLNNSLSRDVKKIESAWPEYTVPAPTINK